MLQFAAAFAALILALGGDKPEPPDGLVCLTEAYPDRLRPPVLDPSKGWQLRWADGTLMDWDDNRTDKDFHTRLNQPDLEDQMGQAYPLSADYDPPEVDSDPGRIRYEPFFRKMYGDSAKAVRKNLVTIRWLPESVNRRLKVTSVNRVDKALQAVSDDLALLDSAARKLGGQTSGPFNWRKIHGTDRLSSHSFAIALDIGVKKSDYWRWNKPGPDGRYPYRNRIPLDIVQVFEKHGFIWGGKWYHYDTMHFEYRPELLDPRCTGIPQSPNREGGGSPAGSADDTPL